MAVTVAAASYDEVMLDWAVAELQSPTWAAGWSGPVFDGLRSKVATGGTGSLSEYECSWLIGFIGLFRIPIISIHGPFRSWTFARASVSPQELSRFSILPSFPYPAFSFGDLWAKIRDQPGDQKESAMRAAVMAIASAPASDHAPIAVIRPDGSPPLLVEGYKRSMAALWRNQASIEIFLCRP